MKYIVVFQNQGLVFHIANNENNEPKLFDDKELAIQAVKCFTNNYKIIEVNINKGDANTSLTI